VATAVVPEAPEEPVAGDPVTGPMALTDSAVAAGGHSVPAVAVPGVPGLLS
jgi:hypothetical protein